MPVVLIILSVGLLGLIIYFAVSPKSSRLLRLTAIGALALIGLSIGICGFFLIRGPSSNDDTLPLPVFQDASPQPVKNNNIIVMIVFLAVLLLILGASIIISLRDQKKTGTGAVKNTLAPKLATPDIPDNDESLFDDDDESFEIETD